MRFRSVVRILCVILLCPLCGCATSPRFAPIPVANPMFVAVRDQDYLWERTVDVLHDYPFEIARQNQLDRVIETEYKVGSGVLEPWHRESVGSENRLESTLQSVRRKVIVRIIPEDGGYLLSVEAFKELEDLDGLAANSAGGATFQEHSPLERNLNPVVGQTAPSGWIPLGRDPLLEQDMLHRLQVALSR